MFRVIRPPVGCYTASAIIVRLAVAIQGQCRHSDIQLAEAGFRTRNTAAAGDEKGGSTRALSAVWATSGARTGRLPVTADSGWR